MVTYIVTILTTETQKHLKLQKGEHKLSPYYGGGGGRFSFIFKFSNTCHKSILVVLLQVIIKISEGYKKNIF